MRNANKKNFFGKNKMSEEKETTSNTQLETMNQDFGRKLDFKNNCKESDKAG